MKIVELGNYIKQVRGVSYSSGDSIKESKSEYLPILRSNNIKESFLNFEDLVYVPKEIVKEHQFLKKGDILITASTGSIKVIGKNGQVKKDFKGSFGAFCKVVRPLDTIDAGYLKHYFQSKNYRRYIKNIVNGANINNIKNGHIDKLKIPLPPLKIQKEIAAILDEADKLRQLDKKLIEKYDALSQSLFLDMFGDPVTNPKGWTKKAISQISKKIQIGPFGSQLHQSDYEELGYSLINPTNIVEGQIEISTCRKINRMKFQSLPNYHLKVGDIIMARRGDLSKIAIVEDVNLFCGTGSLFVRFKDEINPNYVSQALKHKSSIEKLYEKARGITMANLNKTIIKQFVISIPPNELQDQYAKRVQAIEAQKALAQKSLEKSEDLFNSLLQKAFKGELVN